MLPTSASRIALKFIADAGRAPHSSSLCCKLLAVCLIAAPVSLWAGAGATEPGGNERAWRFRVMLDGKEIGFHRYEVESEGDRRIVESRAEFDVKFLFFNAYSYRHSLNARWNGSCLEYLEADTNANGDRVSVTGERKDDEFVVVKGGERKDALPSCIMNFAYWDRRILEQSRLLNPQTGEYLDVAVQSLADDEVEVNGSKIEAEAYRITAKDMRIDLWYSKEGKRWIALESLARGDRIIRYERTGIG